ncbi:proton extrusion protein PcxA [Romeria aff. gracilis LEGE 07310]|uniref:Proton extrusion protein PxcA n=1 Tax=Vasconcelosia minhoensis LEGE 07310 TaxID=915328 RepID=A0A8J7AIB1_9CYAN|nr:proton extrusion protein PcxA [Romeria gracilis]MBE9075930.1 proton extrusion protein PcxA [Romeria aff. gracilis LEGE 07310]
MSNSIRLGGLFRTARQWFTKTPERALDQAYEAALKIQQIEVDYFDGNPISADYGDYGQSAQAYFETELKKYLNLIRMRMGEFRSSSSIFRVDNERVMEVQLSEHVDDDYALDLIDRPAAFFRKLRVIDDVLARYADAPGSAKADSTLATTSNPVPNPTSNRALKRSEIVKDSSLREVARTPQADAAAPSNEGLSAQSSVLPRSILRTVDRIRQDLDPEAEDQVVRNFRSSKTKTTMALRFILFLIIVPLITQQVSKNFIVGPVVNYVRDSTNAEVFLNMEMEEEALHELQQFEERLRFEVLIGKAPPLNELRIEEQVREKAFEIEEAYRQRSSDAVKNVFSDMIAALAFGLLLSACGRQVAALKGFMDEIVYGLSDSAKAFIIILFTDMFVGFHSPHGWEVLLEGLSRHLGFSANHNFIFLFIATFPVILDTVFKYWIFRYLNRISPSAVATYKNMNE